MPSWDEIENQINKEVIFLSRNIIPSPYRQDDFWQGRSLSQRTTTSLVLKTVVVP